VNGKQELLEEVADARERGRRHVHDVAAIDLYVGAQIAVPDRVEVDVEHLGRAAGPHHLDVVRVREQRGPADRAERLGDPHLARERERRGVAHLAEHADHRALCARERHRHERAALEARDPVLDVLGDLVGGAAAGRDVADQLDRDHAVRPHDDVLDHRGIGQDRDGQAIGRADQVFDVPDVRRGARRMRTRHRAQ